MPEDKKKEKTFADKMLLQEASSHNRDGEKPNYKKSHTPMSYDYVTTSHKLLDSLYRFSAMGGAKGQNELFFTGIDRFHQNIIPSNTEYSGVTFITRPKLNLSNTSLYQDRILSPLDTMDAHSISFAIRWLLDTNLKHVYKKAVTAAADSPLLNYYSPFLTPLCMGLTGMSGWPDPVLSTHTTTGGYFNEDQTFAIGTDGLRKSYSLSLNFKDIQGGPISAIFEYWIKWMELAVTGRVRAYSEDIDAQRMPYTVSIYRFILDPSRRIITRYAKATGCFPKSVPTGGMFNVNDYTNPVEGVAKFAIPFECNNVAYNDYVSLISFNTLMRRYCPGIKDLPNLPDRPEFNYMGLPYIENNKKSKQLELVYKDISSLEHTAHDSLSDVIMRALKSVTHKSAKKMLREYRRAGIIDQDTFKTMKETIFG